MSMAEEASEDRLRPALAALDAREKKIVGSVVTTMIGHSDRVRDREWMSEQFVAAVALASDLEAAPDPEEGLAAVQAYAREHIDRLMTLAFGLFSRTASDMGERDSFTFEDAVARATEYLA